MARYKKADYSQTVLVTIDFQKQILPGTFEFTINELIDNKIDLSGFDQKYNNDDLGAPAYLPGVLLKIILYAYYKGIFSSRKIAEACLQNIVFIALSANSRPHFTTIADFVSSIGRSH
ncbi:transposase [bacterium]|nr:transposase [bacterium]